MFEKFLSTNTGDFRQRYADTFGWFVKDDKKILVKLTDIEDRAVYFEDKSGLGYHLNVDAPGNTGFEFIPPKNAYHNIRSGAILIKRVAQRQFSRGLCDRNTKFTTAGGMPMKINFDILDQIFVNPVSKQEAISNFLDKKVDSLALSPSFALVRGLINCYEVTIGNYTDEHKYTVTDMWTTEFRDALSRNNLTGIFKEAK